MPMPLNVTEMLRDDAITMPVGMARLHDGQRKILSDAKRFNVLSCGRRWGKTTFDKVLASITILAGGNVGYFAPSYELLLEFWNEMCAELSPVIAGNANQKQHTFTVKTGGKLKCWTLMDVNAGRSKHYDLVIIDEAGLFPLLMTSWEQNIAATLMDYSGWAWFNGTPKGRNGFWSLYQNGKDPNKPEWASFQRPTHDNPHIPPEEIARMAETITERHYDQEIMAAFLIDGGVVFRFVTEQSTGEVEVGPVKGHEYTMGVDWGRSGDYTVISIIDATESRQVWIERFNGNYELQYARVTGLLRHWKPTIAWVEENAAGKPIIDRFNEDGFDILGFYTSNQSKRKIIDSLALAMERHELTLIHDPIQEFELMAYEATELPSGLIRFSAPDGEQNHDDTVIALALAWNGAKGFRPEVKRSIISLDEAALYDRAIKTFKHSNKKARREMLMGKF